MESTPRRRSTVIIVTALVGAFALAAPVSALVSATQQQGGAATPNSVATVPAAAVHAEPTVTSVVVPESSLISAAPTTTSVPVAKAKAPAAPKAAPAVKASSAVTPAAPATTAPTSVDDRVEIGTACVIYADGTSEGCA